MYKKIMAALCAAVMLCTASACGEKGENTRTEPSAGESETQGKALSFSNESGMYGEAFELEISGADEIWYTLDGSDPTESETAQRYEGAINIADRSGDANVVSAVSPSLFCTSYSKYSKDEGITCNIAAPSDSAVDKCTVVRAAAKINGEFTAVCTNTYFIGTSAQHIGGIEKSCEAAGKPLAVISITMDYADLFDSAQGIYVKGDIFDAALEEFVRENPRFNPEDTRKLAANYSQRGRAWEREAHIDFFEMDKDGASLVLEQDCGVRIQGNYSRSDLQKSFRFFARRDYGESKFAYKIFGDGLTDEKGEAIDKFDTFVARAGGNCAFTSKYNDTFWQELSSGTDCATKASRPCVIYLNGEYWGLYVLEEDFSDDFFEDHYGVAAEDVVVYKGDAETYEIGYKLDEGKLPDGINDEGYYFRELTDFFGTHKSLESDADYEEFAKLVDVESVRDYFAVEVWINNKWDWPGKNWSMWKTVSTDSGNEYADGRWRFCIYDVEFGGVSGASDAGTNTIKEDNYKPKGLLDTDTENPAVLCFAYLMTNEGFRTDYCGRLSELSDTVFEKEHALEVLKSYEDIYGPLFPQFFDRYKGAGTAADALNGGYASSKCIRDFLNKRADNIQRMIDWVNRQY
ncbi:MAG: CotH kinase family protein [Butyrivibrio sp.]|nr:CotH kinase family protein [Butyrivibrio sp.]